MHSDELTPSLHLVTASKTTSTIITLTTSTITERLGFILKHGHLNFKKIVGQHYY